MKKILILVATLALLSNNVSKSEDSSSKKTSMLVSIDSISLMQRSKEGKLLAKKIQKEIEDFQASIKNAQKELVEYQETVSKQSKVLSKEALMEKSEKLAKMKKNAERDLADKEEALKLSVQRQQAALREKQMAVTNEVFEKKGWGMMIDRNTPGVLFVSNSIDVTDDLLKAVDEKYDSEIAKTLIEKKATSKKGA